MEVLRGVNSFVPVTTCSLAKSPEAVPLEALLSIDAFDLAKMLEDAGMDLSRCSEVQDEAETAVDHGHESHADSHGGSDHEHESHSQGYGHGHGKAAFRHDIDIGSFVCELVG